MVWRKALDPRGLVSATQRPTDGRPSSRKKFLGRERRQERLEAMCFPFIPSAGLSSGLYFSNPDIVLLEV